MHEEIMAAIRQAFSSEDFATAQRLWDDYAAGVRQAILDGSATAELMTEMLELVDWSRSVALSFRAHATECLNQSHIARIYGQTF